MTYNCLPYTISIVKKVVYAGIAGDYFIIRQGFKRIAKRAVGIAINEAGIKPSPGFWLH